jgi:hypothetical protein
MNIPMVDPAGEYRALKSEIDAAVGRVFSSGRFVLGPEGERSSEKWPLSSARAMRWA